MTTSRSPVTGCCMTVAVLPAQATLGFLVFAVLTMGDHQVGAVVWLCVMAVAAATAAAFFARDRWPAPAAAEALLAVGWLLLLADMPQR